MQDNLQDENSLDKEKETELVSPEIQYSHKNPNSFSESNIYTNQKQILHVPMSERNPDNSGTKVPAVLPFILGIVSVIAALASLFSIPYLDIAGALVGLAAIILGSIAKREGKLAIIGATLGIIAVACGGANVVRQTFIIYEEMFLM